MGGTERGGGQAGLRAALRLLRLMIEGRELKAADVVGPDGRRAVQSARLRALADHLNPWVVRRGAGRGIPQAFRWSWPNEQASRPEQVWALAASRTMLAAFRDSEVGRVLTDLLEEHASRLPTPPAREDLDRMFFAATRLINPRNVEPDSIDRLATAISERRTVTASYTQFGGDAHTVRIEPWTLIFADEGPYLYGKCLESTKPDHVETRRVFNVGRMKNIRGTKQRFVYPLRQDHDPEDVFRHCFTVMVPADGAGPPANVVLRFDASMAPYLQQHRIHPTQEDPAQDTEGRVVVRLTLHVTYDLVRWVRGHGCTVEVLEPANLRDWVVEGVGGAGYKRFVLDRA